MRCPRANRGELAGAGYHEGGPRVLAEEPGDVLGGKELELLPSWNDLLQARSSRSSHAGGPTFPAARRANPGSTWEEVSAKGL